MEDDDVPFDMITAAVPEPARKQLSRLKRALSVAQTGLAALQQAPHLSAPATTARALTDKTNTSAATEQASLRPLAASRTGSNSAAAKSSSSSPKQPSPCCSSMSDRQPAASDCTRQSSQPPALMDMSDHEADPSSKAASEEDYWDSEDELEAELTRRERAEGFHADSPTPTEDKADPDGDSDSNAGSPAKSGSPDYYAELNSQTQRVLRDSAKRDTIGQGQAIQRQALSGILGKIVSRKEAIAARAPAVPPVRAAKLVKQAKVTPAALAARLHAQANRLLVKTAAPDDDDILVLSDDASDPDAEDEAAVLADASLSLKQAKQLVAQHKTQVPRQNRLGLPVGAAGSAPQDDPQEIGFDSIPFEEPELFRASGSGVAGKTGAADMQSSTLHLRLDSQDDVLAEDEHAQAQAIAAVSSPGKAKEFLQSAEDASLAQADAAAAGSAAEDEAAECAVQSDNEEVEEDEVADQDEDEEHELSASEDESDDASSSERSDEDEQSSAEAGEESEEGCEGSGADEEETSSPSEAEAGEKAADATGWWQKAHHKPAKSKQQVPLYNEFVDAEAEMSEDEGHSQGDAEEDADDDGDLEDLIGQGRDRHGDEARRAKLHQQWLEQQDAQQVAHLLHGVRTGFRRKRAGDLLDDDVGDDWDTRKRRARVGEDDDSELSEEEDRLAGLIHMDADDNEDTELTEQARQELRHASALRNANGKSSGNIDLDADSQEILTLLSSASQGNISQGPQSKLLASTAGLPGSHAPPTAQQATFMGRSVPVLAGAWAASQMASRSYVFGRDDSNSAAAPTDGVSGGGQVPGPTSFSGLDSIIKDGSSQAASASSAHLAGREAGRKSSLLGRLAGQSGGVGNAAGSMSALDLQHALSASFGAQAVARANSAMRRNKDHS